MGGNIILVGYMGTGKTAVGEALAERLDWDYIDTDDLIEEKAGKSIPSIFTEDGEPHFRDLETAVINKLEEKKNSVIATGGGAVLREENMNNMKRAGIVVCLEASPEVIFERTRKFTHRPLLQVPDPMAKIREMLEFRHPYYAKAPHSIDTSKLTIDEVVEKIIELHEQNR